MSVYGERCGALSVVCPDAAEAELVLGQLKSTVRRNYSSPPIHGGQIVARVLTDPGAARRAGKANSARCASASWRCARSCTRVLAAKLPGRDFGYFLTQRGMFSYTGLTTAQVDRLREVHGVYLVRSGRICVAGLNSGERRGDGGGDGGGAGRLTRQTLPNHRCACSPKPGRDAGEAVAAHDLRCGNAAAMRSASSRRPVEPPVK